MRRVSRHWFEFLLLATTSFVFRTVFVVDHRTARCDVAGVMLVSEDYCIRCVGGEERGGEREGKKVFEFC